MEEDTMSNSGAFVAIKMIEWDFKGTMIYTGNEDGTVDDWMNLDNWHPVGLVPDTPGTKNGVAPDVAIPTWTKTSEDIKANPVFS